MSELEILFNGLSQYVKISIWQKKYNLLLSRNYKIQLNTANCFLVKIFAHQIFR